MAYSILRSASHQIDDIYIYTAKTWGEVQADAYITGLFECFNMIVDRKILWRSIPAAYGVDGYYADYEKHRVYWKVLMDGEIGIAAVLHERMNHGDRLTEM
ncbi:type II toxin-antitoxin system RelE/ParE family toxin [Robiginitomaculum antarcticum]|uniref:type II toxin-antitoxin system RelE/ParE family toxin n=1 Tax=Robiginitomaculum antarcticum TaxID=437507 RepID=UPI00036D2DE9|nr:type II toxin-antitoxin system RelE/ParE family toxin [Robiginitomaculum antarcticum]